ncbi:MAG: hypothetical protein CMP22_03515 [Rickettsiales bacterium]|nr:hypothetical protein [Rickettsiales bacterium]|tara:strand:+ start:2961 stop:3515 length:555 start_codon:yes stop_codon:yes gene_type:complete
MRLNTVSKIYSVLLISTLALGACTYTPNAGGPKYWQRIDTHSALYLQGAKAQQTLEEDMSRCVTEIEELVRLGAVRKKLPEGQDSMSEYKIDAGSSDVYWNVPMRYGYRYVDHSQYHDFDSCMRYRGWKRVAFNDFKTLQLSHDTYDKLKKDRLDQTSHGAVHRRDEDGDRVKTSNPDFQDLNQ